MLAIFKHELSSYFRSLTAYIFGAFLLVLIGIGALMYNIQAAVANFEYVLAFVCLGFVVLVPILTMRVIAEERKQKTDQLLYSLPITTTDIVVGKFGALLAVYLVPIVIICFYPAIFARYGEVYLLTSYGSIFAFFMLGAALLSMGMFISSLTENQGFAAGIGVVVVLFNYYSVSLAENISSTALGSALVICSVAILLGLVMSFITKNDTFSYGISLGLVAIVCVIFFINSSLFEGLVPKLMSELSLFEHFYVFVDGVFDMSGIVYFVSVIVFFLFLTVQSLEKRRYN